MDLARDWIREPDAVDAAHYRRRVTQLAWIYPALFATSLGGLAVVVWRGRFFVTLAQRSNVETLTIAFFLLFFSYLAFVTSTGAFGGLRLAAFRLRERLARDRDRAVRPRLAALGRPCAGPSVALNRALERAGRPGEPFELVIRDRLGSMGRLRIDGVRVQLRDTHRAGSNNLLAYFAQQVDEVLGGDVELEIVQWKTLDDEAWHQYVAGVDAMRALERRLPGDGPLWPRLVLDDGHCRDLERRLADVCDALRDESLLPHWEFAGEHKLPIIPEPLGIISLSRSERRVDPLSSMASALVVVAVAVALMTWFLLSPPWVPGR